MKAFFCFIILFACAFCASKKSERMDPNFKNEVRAKIIDCISSTDGISQTLKEHLEKVKTSDERIPLHFSKVELEDKDREIIKNCKREVFKERRKKMQESSL